MKEYELSLYQRPEHYIGKYWDGWYTGLGRHANSDCLTNVNFEVFLEKVRAASDKLSILEPNMGWDAQAMEIDSVYVVCERHWAVPWIEWIAIHPSDKGAMTKAAELMESLNIYPVLDEDRWSQREEEEIDEFWKQCSLKERMSYCQDAGTSIFAARRDYPNEEVFYWLKDTWN